jgi:hypothetical protein
MGLLGPTCWLAPPRPLRIPARHVSHARVSGVFLGCYAAGNECGRRYLEMSRTIACSALPGRCAPRPGAGTAAGPAIRPASRSHNGLEARRLVYREGLLVGYRGYDQAAVPVRPRPGLHHVDLRIGGGGRAGRGQAPRTGTGVRPLRPGGRDLAPPARRVHRPRRPVIGRSAPSAAGQIIMIPNGCGWRPAHGHGRTRDRSRLPRRLRRIVDRADVA